MNTLVQIEKECGYPRYKDQIEKIQSQYLAPFATKVPREGAEGLRSRLIIMKREASFRGIAIDYSFEGIQETFI